MPIHLDTLEYSGFLQLFGLRMNERQGIHISRFIAFPMRRLQVLFIKKVCAAIYRVTDTRYDKYLFRCESFHLVGRRIRKALNIGFAIKRMGVGVPKNASRSSNGYE